MLSNSSLQTFGSWASKGLKSAAATLESAAVAGKAVVESKLQELVESDDEQNDNPPGGKQLMEEQPTADSLVAARDSGREQRDGSSEILYFNPNPQPDSLPPTGSFIHADGGPVSSTTADERNPPVNNQADISQLDVPPLLPSARPHIAQPPVEQVLADSAQRPATRSDESVSATSVMHVNEDNGTVNQNVIPLATASRLNLMRDAVDDGQTQYSTSSPVIPEPGRPERDGASKTAAVSADVGQLMDTTARMSSQIVELESLVKSLQEDRDTLAGQCSALEQALWAKAEECKTVMLAAESAAKLAAMQREEAENTLRAESTAKYDRVREELQRCQDLLVKKEVELSQARDRVIEFESAAASTLGVTSNDLTRAEAQVAALQSSLQLAEEARLSVEAKFKQLLGARRLLGDQAEPDEDFHRWVPRLEERLAQIVARGQALESANNKMTAELNNLLQANQQLQRQLEDATARANQRAPAATWHQSSHGVGLDDAKMETVMALEARLAAKAQRLDALVTENHSLKMQLQNKTGASPFSHVQDEFQKTIMYSLVIRPVFRVLAKFGGGRKFVKHGTEDTVKRWYMSLFASRPMQRIW